MAHALAKERRGLVGSVTGQKHRAGLPAFRNQSMKPVGRSPDDPMGATLDPGGDQGGDRVGLHHRLVLAREEHEFPASVIAPTRYDRGGPVGIAEHDRQLLQVGAFRHPREGGKRQGLRDFGIDDQPRLVEIQIIQCDFEQFTNRAAGAVTRDHISGPDGR